MSEYFQHVTGTREERIYFEERDERLRIKLRAELEKRSGDPGVRHALATAEPTDARQVADALRRLGLNEETASLLPVLPLVYVAWADGSLKPAERREVLLDADRLGVMPGTTAWAYLHTLLEDPPSPELLDTLLEALKLVLKHHGQTPGDIVDCCRYVAHAAGGLWGIGAVSVGERAVLDRITEKLGPDPHRHLGEVLDA